MSPIPEDGIESTPMHHHQPHHDKTSSSSPEADAAPEHGGEGNPRDLVLVKNGRRYLFRCAPGEEKQLLHRIGEMAQDPHTDLTWFDAATIAHQAGRHMSEQLEQINPGPGPAPPKTV